VKFDAYWWIRPVIIICGQLCHCDNNNKRQTNGYLAKKKGILLSDVPCLRHVVVHNKPHLPGKQVKIIVVTPVFTESERYRLLIRWSIDLRRGEGHITRISDYDVKVEIGI